MAMDLKWLLSADDKASPVFDKLKGSATEAAKGVEGAFSGAMSKFNLLTGVVGTMMTVAMGGAFAKVIKETVAWTGEAVALSKALGITTQQASVLNVALGDVYLTKETMLAGSARIAKTLKTEEEAFTKLGVATRDQTGHYRSTLDIMTDVNTKLGTLREGTDRNVAGMTIYGKSWQELSGLIKLNSEVMKEAQEKAKRLGLEVGEESVKSAKKYKAALNDIEDVAKSLTVRFGVVLLPMLVKVGAFLGNNGPILSDAFRISLLALGKTVTTVGEWLGLMAYRAVSLGSIIKSVLTGNFSDAAAEMKNFAAAGKDFNERTAAKWKDWKAEDVTSKASKGDQLDKDFGAKAEDKIKIWTDTAKKIIEIEKDRIKTLLDAEKEYLGKLKAGFDEHVKELEAFQGSVLKIREKMDARNKTAAEEALAAQRIGEDSYSKYFRQQAELASGLEEIESSPGFSSKSIAEKAEKYNELIDKAKLYVDAVKAGQVDNVSYETAERNYLAFKAETEGRILDITNQQEQQLTDLAVKEAEAITRQEKKVKLLEDQVRILDHMIKNIPDITEKQINLKINGIQDLYKVQSLMNNSGSTTGAVSYGDYYTMGGQTFWSDGSLADAGTGYVEGRASGGPVKPYATYRVNEDGTEFLTMGSQGGFITPAGQGASIDVSGGIHITVQGGATGPDSAREIARMLLPELQQLQSRTRVATR